MKTLSARRENLRSVLYSAMLANVENSVARMREVMHQIIKYQENIVNLDMQTNSHFLARSSVKLASYKRALARLDDLTDSQLVRVELIAHDDKSRRVKANDILITIDSQFALSANFSIFNRVRVSERKIKSFKFTNTTDRYRDFSYNLKTTRASFVKQTVDCLMR